jgi:hypothetical protein
MALVGVHGNHSVSKLAIKVCENLGGHMNPGAILLPDHVAQGALEVVEGLQLENAGVSDQLPVFSPINCLILIKLKFKGLSRGMEAKKDHHLAGVLAVGVPRA